jgi:hypothetical protein
MLISNMELESVIPSRLKDEVDDFNLKYVFG